MVDRWEKTDSLLFAGQILFSPDFGREIWCKQHFLEGSRRWDICGKCILCDIRHRLQEASYGEHDTYWFLSSVTRVGAPLSSLAHKRPLLGRVAEGRLKGCLTMRTVPSFLQGFPLPKCSYLIFISMALVFWYKPGLLRNWRSLTQWMWFRIQLTVPTSCWRCYKSSLEAGCLHIENENTAVQEQSTRPNTVSWPLHQ